MVVWVLDAGSTLYGQRSQLYGQPRQSQNIIRRVVPDPGPFPPSRHRVSPFNLDIILRASDSVSANGDNSKRA